MKTIGKISFLLMVLGVTLCSFSSSGTVSKTSKIFIYKGVEGRWKYNVQNVDPQYQEGVLYIAKESGKYTVNIMTANGGPIPAEEVEVKGNEVKFVVYVEEDRVEIILMIDGDSFAGSGTSSEGPFTMTGERTPDPQ